MGRATSAAQCLWACPVGDNYQFDGAIGTAMGPRDTAWIKATAADPRQGIDYFSWWEEGQGELMHRPRAKSDVGTDVRWRPPLTDEETDRLVGAAGLLESAYRLDASLAYPWREWHEILGYLGADTPLAAEVARRADQTPDGPKVGYRRRNVTVDLTGGWTVEVPGSLAEILGWKRYRASLGCVKVALLLGDRLGTDPEEAPIAGGNARQGPI